MGLRVRRGDAVGLIEGTPVGFGDGIIVGTSVTGRRDGKKVGSIVGSCDGASVGTSVTKSATVVGLKDGNSVGISDGATVGIPAHKTNPSFKDQRHDSRR